MNYRKPRFYIMLHVAAFIRSHLAGIRYLTGFLCLSVLCFELIDGVFAAGSGQILSLTVSGGSQHGDTITISTTVEANGKIQNSNLFFQIIAPGGAVVATNSTSAPALDAGQQFSYSWTSNNSSYPTMGNYTVVLCWNNGGSGNCGIAQASTSFYSVPTFDGIFGLAALVILGVFLRKLKFAKPETTR